MVINNDNIKKDKYIHKIRTLKDLTENNGMLAYKIDRPTYSSLTKTNTLILINTLHNTFLD